MQTSKVLNCFALFFRRCEEADWLPFVEPALWEDFLASASSGSSKGKKEIPACLKEALPFPAFEAFANRHFTGGLPTSIQAVESLYRNWTGQLDSQLLFAGESGFYDSDSAAHMRYLYQQFEIEIAPESILPADHLSLLLGFLALLIENALPLSVMTFIDEHLDWLDELFNTIVARTPEADWLIAITELLIDYIAFLGQEAASEVESTETHIAIFDGS